MSIEMIAFDADDTLWHAETIFKKAEEKFYQILSPYQDPELIEDKLSEIETQNIYRYGFGVKSYTLSMIETALIVSNGEITGKSIARVLKVGQAMLDEDLVLIPGVEETLEKLSEDYPLMVITKGDLLEQTSKIQRSGLADYFSFIEVLSHKSKQAYRELLKKFKINPGSFIMVGNSLPSDIQPILSLGGIGIHIPADITWAHELMDDFETSQENFYEIEHMGQLIDLLPELK
jgi:putative hydrolase of the HAD superfamily